MATCPTDEEHALYALGWTPELHEEVWLHLETGAAWLTGWYHGSVRRLAREGWDLWKVRLYDPPNTPGFRDIETKLRALRPYLGKPGPLAKAPVDSPNQAELALKNLSWEPTEGEPVWVRKGYPGGKAWYTAVVTSIYPNAGMAYVHSEEHLTHGVDLDRLVPRRGR